MRKFTHLMKIIFVFKVLLQTLHFGIHKWELHRRNLVASVVYFSQTTDVVFAIFQSQAIQTPLCAVSSGSLWWRPLGLYDLFFCLGSGNFGFCLIWDHILSWVQCFNHNTSRLVPWSLNWPACVLKKKILRIKMTHFAFRSYQIINFLPFLVPLFYLFTAADCSAVSFLLCFKDLCFKVITQ